MKDMTTRQIHAKVTKPYTEFVGDREVDVVPFGPNYSVGDVPARSFAASVTM